jgi:hypothetical protein
MVLVSSFAVLIETSASGTPPISLFVAANATGTSCLDNSTNACPTIQDAITVAEQATYEDDAVTINVAAGAYLENDTIEIPANETLLIQGAGSTSTTVDPLLGTSIFSINYDPSGNGPVTIDGFTIKNADAVGQVSGMNPSGDSGGGGIYNDGSYLTVNDSVFLNDVTNAHNSSTPSVNGGAARGGAIDDVSGALSLFDDTFTDDTATGGSGDSAPGGAAEGGAIYYTGDNLYVEYVTFNGDVATGGIGGNNTASAFDGGSGYGGALYSLAPTLTVDAATLTNDVANGAAGGNSTSASGGNAGDGFGGGIYDYGSHSTLAFDTFSNDVTNGAAGGTGTTPGIGGFGLGGGYYATGNPEVATLTNDTFYADAAHGIGTAYGIGGAIDNIVGSNITATNLTLADNSVTGTGPVGAGIYNSGTFTLANSILEQSDSCAGTITDGQYNVESDTSCGLGMGGNVDVVGSGAIHLATSLAANGSSGPETLAIDPTSSAYEEVPSSNCTPSSDERGQPRPGVTGFSCDAGAYEWQGYSVT